MSWLARLYETYEAGVKLNLPEDSRPMPISHTLQNAHIHIVIGDNGNFKRASVLEKTQIILPATEKSAGRTSNEAPHPLADKIQYVAKDYSEYGWRKPCYFASYKKILREWCESKFAHPKAVAVYKYISKGKVIEDLIKAKILYVDEQDKLLALWPFENDEDRPVPLIFKTLPTIDKKIRVNEEGKPEVEQGDALVCWSVEVEGEPGSSTWNDESLHQSWIGYEASKSGTPGFCFVTGAEKPLATNHPAKLRHTGDKAKLLSSNDSDGFTFRGRFTDKDGLQAASVGFDVTQKAHNALRWLISRQGFRNGTQTFVAWAVSGKQVPDPLADTWSLLGRPVEESVSSVFPNTDRDHGVDLGQSFAEQFNKYLAGYRSKFDLNEQIIFLGLDSSTPGRMGVIFYRELLASDFFVRLESWHNDFAWYQRYSIEDPTIKKGKKAPKKKTIWPVSSPVPNSIVEAAFGKILDLSEAFKRSTMERIVPCIIDGRPFPRDIMEAAVRRACNRNSCEHWEWERNLGVACALYKGFHKRHPDNRFRRKYTMALEEERKTRDYLFGRLLAIAERIEEVALRLGDENRPTTAARLMQRFADRPSSTWRNIEMALQPYMQRLQQSRSGFLTNRRKELDAVISAFNATDFTDDKPLTGEFLLGYHCQRLTYRNKKNETTQEDE